ncbi:unnamed protein product, partial [marine sediment metagenome]
SLCIYLFISKYIIILYNPLSRKEKKLLKIINKLKLS